MVIDHVAVNHRGVGRAIEPPNFVVALIGAGKELVLLLQVDVAKDVLAQWASKRLHTTGVHVELIEPHPVGNVGCRGLGVGASNRDVVAQNLEAPDIGWAKVLHGVDGSIGPDQNFLPCLLVRNNGRPGAQTEAARLIGDSRGPQCVVLLIRPAHKQRVNFRFAVIVAAKCKHKT